MGKIYIYIYFIYKKFESDLQLKNINLNIGKIYIDI